MNERNPMLHCPEAYDIIVGRRTQGGGVLAGQPVNIQSHNWNESNHSPLAVVDDVPMALYYCTRCTSTRDDYGKLQYKNIGEAPPDATADKVTPIRKG